MSKGQVLIRVFMIVSLIVYGLLAGISIYKEAERSKHTIEYKIN